MSDKNSESHARWIKASEHIDGVKELLKAEVTHLHCANSTDRESPLSRKILVEYKDEEGYPS
tara:strand:- start:1294 stop:1479 length:186 start_codon:yes stop_codon:yes gene_type:complete